MAERVPESFHVAALQRAYADGLDPCDLVEAILARIKAHDDPALFLSLIEPTALNARAKALDDLAPEQKAKMPLFGIPFAVKDNIDVAGSPTTAACPAFAYVPGKSAHAVDLLQAAGAIV